MVACEDSVISFAIPRDISIRGRLLRSHSPRVSHRFTLPAGFSIHYCSLIIDRLQALSAGRR